MPNGSTTRFIFTGMCSVVPSKHMRMVSDMLKAIHASEDREAALAKAHAVTEKLRAMRLKEAATKIDEAFEEPLTFYGFPASH